MRNPHFYTNDQEAIYKEIYLHKDYSVVVQHTLDIPYMRNSKHKGYFDETLAMCEEFGLIDIMKENHPYIEYYIIQFFATVYLDHDEARTLYWMTKDTLLSATMAEFGELLGYEDKGESVASGWRCHDNDRSSSKDVLGPITMERGTTGKTAHLVRPFEILHRVYRETIAPLVGNWDEVHGFMFDLLKLSYENQGKGKKLDVMDWMWNDLWSTIIDRRAPIYGPYIMKLIRRKWALKKNGEDIMKDGSPVVTHLVKELRIKAHLPPKTKPLDPEAAAEAERASGSAPPLEEPTWFKKLQIKLKRAFCLKLDLEDRLYEAHVYHKKAAQQQKAMMRHMQIPVFDGSEEVITPKNEWVSKQGFWSDDDAPPGGARFLASSSSTHHDLGGA